MIGSVSGRHRSPTRGSSLEFSEYRKYVPGDDTRRLDWRAWGRSDRFYLQAARMATVAAILIAVGGALFFGTLLFVWWLTAAAAGPNAYATVQWFMETLIGRLILFGYTWALIHHMLGGIRHLIWDTGRGFGAQEREWMAVANLVGSVGLTIVLWFVGYLVMGGIR